MNWERGEKKKENSTPSRSEVRTLTRDEIKQSFQSACPFSEMMEGGGKICKCKQHANTAWFTTSRVVGGECQYLPPGGVNLLLLCNLTLLQPLKIKPLSAMGANV